MSVGLIIAFLAFAAIMAGFYFATRAGKEGLLLNFHYTPACGSTWDGSRSPDCRGLTGGVMPSIETTNYSSSGLCCGYLGVPP